MKRSGSSSNPGSGNNAMRVTMEQANQMAMNELADSTTSLLEHTKRLHTNLRDQNERLHAMIQNSMDADDGMTSSRKFVKDIVDDQSAIGVCKIAIIVFTTLSVIYFGGKFGYK